MPIAEWENIVSLVTPLGQLNLNAEQAEGLYLVDHAGADSGTDVRATGQGVPQGDGSILHRGFTDGYGLKLPIQYWVDRKNPACATSSPTAQQMEDRLMRHLRSIMDGGGRVFYHPAGEDLRLLDSVRLIAKPQLTEAPAATGTVVTVASEFPYLIDFNQIKTTLSAGSPTVTLTNGGSAPLFPVFKVYGSFDDFILSNLTSGMQIAYDDSQPGAVAVTSPDHIEINTFRNTVYLNGDGASRKAGIVIPSSDFFALNVGDNDLEIASSGTAPNVDVLWQAAWW